MSKALGEKEGSEDDGWVRGGEKGERGWDVHCCC
jgi:hypothetical protein